MSKLNSQNTGKQQSASSDFGFFAAGAFLGMLLFPSLSTRKERLELDKAQQSLDKCHADYLRNREHAHRVLYGDDSAEQKSPPVTR